MAGGERKMRADAQRNFDRLVDAGRAAFAEHGAEAPMDEVARRAGVGPGTLYRHFPTRHALLATVYRTDLEAFVDQARAAARDLEPAEAMAVWLRELLDYAKQKQGLGSAVKTMLSEDVETFAYCRTLVRAALEEVLEPARRAGALREDATSQDILRLVHGLGTAAAGAPEDSDRLLRFVLDGLRPPGSPTA